MIFKFLFSTSFNDVYECMTKTRHYNTDQWKLLAFPSFSFIPFQGNDNSVSHGKWITVWKKGMSIKSKTEASWEIVHVVRFLTSKSTQVKVIKLSRAKRHQWYQGFFLGFPCIC